MNTKNYQFIWWGPPKYWRTPKFHVNPPMPQDGPHKGAIYEWRLSLGWLEIRRWGQAAK